MFTLQAGPNGANRAKRLRHVMATNAKVRDALIAREILRIKCANLWGLITPTRLLIKPQKSRNSNNAMGEQNSADHPMEHAESGEQNKQMANSVADKETMAIDAGISEREKRNPLNGKKALNKEKNSVRQPNSNREAVDNMDCLLYTSPSPRDRG